MGFVHKSVVQRVRAVDGCFVAVAVVIVGVKRVQPGAKLGGQLIRIAVTIRRNLRIVVKLIDVGNRIVVIDFGVQNLIKRIAMDERSQVVKITRVLLGFRKCFLLKMFAH